MTQPNSDTPLGARTLAFLGCRVLALYFLFTGIQSLGFVLQSVVQLQDFTHLDSRVTSVLVLAFLMCVFVLLWFGASWLSGKMVRGLEGSPASDALDPYALSGVLTAVFGVVIVSYGLLNLVSYGGVLIEGDHQLDTARWIGIIFKIVLGAGLVLGAGFIARVIRRARRW